jgi:hypothetical protein
LIGQQVEVQVQSLLQTGAGMIIFAEPSGKAPVADAPGMEGVGPAHPGHKA